MLTFAELPMGAKKREAASKRRVAPDATGDDSTPCVRKYFGGSENEKDKEVQAAMHLHATLCNIHRLSHGSVAVPSVEDDRVLRSRSSMQWRLSEQTKLQSIVV